METLNPITATTVLPPRTGGRRLILPMAIALLGLIVNIIVASSMAITSDEPAHVAYGGAILRGEPDRVETRQFDSKMPVSALNALPRGLGMYLRDHGKASVLTIILLDARVTRSATLAAAFCLSLLVFFFAESLFGRAAALFAQLIFVIEPNIIAHSTLSTTDLFISFATVLFLYCLRRYLASPDIGNATLAAVALALAQLTKFTAAYLYLVLIVTLFVAAFYSRIPLRKLGAMAALSALCFLAVINVGFLFDRSFTPLTRYSFQSATFRQLQQVPILNAVPLPLPYPYLQGFDQMSYNNLTGRTFGNMALLSQVRGSELPRSDGFAGYYTVAYVLKEPIGLQLVFLLALLWILRNRRSSELLAGEGPLLLTAALFWIVLSLFSRTQIGIRHVLPALVIFTILSGAAFHGWAGFSSRRKLLLAGCLAYAAISVASYFPHMIPYFNEIVTDRKMAYRYLADSNLAWGQDEWVVQRFLKENPDVILNPEQPVTGRILIDANFPAGVRPRKADHFLRLMDIRPVAHVGYGHLLFVLPSR
jgi:hypothetical protein